MLTVAVALCNRKWEGGGMRPLWSCGNPRRKTICSRDVTWIWTMNHWAPCRNRTGLLQPTCLLRTLLQVFLLLYWFNLLPFPHWLLFASGINSGVENDELTATHAARKILSRERNPPIDILIDAHVVPKLVEFLNRVSKYVCISQLSWVFLY